MANNTFGTRTATLLIQAFLLPFIIVMICLDLVMIPFCWLSGIKSSNRWKITSLWWTIIKNIGGNNVSS